MCLKKNSKDYKWEIDNVNLTQILTSEGALFVDVSSINSLQHKIKYIKEQLNKEKYATIIYVNQIQPSPPPKLITYIYNIKI